MILIFSKIFIDTIALNFRNVKIEQWKEINV